MKYCIINRTDKKTFQIVDYIKSKINLTYDVSNPDIIIAVGGDGTIIKAAHLYPNAIIFGVHTGHLGFYAKYTTNEIEVLISDINNNEFNIEENDLLSCNIIDSKDEKKSFNALNEITILTPPRTLILDVYIDDEYFEKFRGTGLCISTPSGSTAYNKSLHGSIIDPLLNTIQLTEIAGINSNAYRTLSSPLVLSSKRRIKLDSLMPQDVFITVDNLSYNIKGFKNLEIYYANKHIKMAYHKKEGFLKRLNRTFLNNEKGEDENA